MRELELDSEAVDRRIGSRMLWSLELQSAASSVCTSQEMVNPKASGPVRFV